MAVIERLTAAQIQPRSPPGLLTTKDMKPFLHYSKTPHGSPRSSPARPAPCLIPTSRALYPTVFTLDSPTHALDSLHLRFRADSLQLQPLASGFIQFGYATAFAAPPASFRRLFRTRALRTFAPLHTTDQGRASEKVSTGYNGQTNDSPVGAFIGCGANRNTWE
jgi:hypothetical protein